MTLLLMLPLVLAVDILISIVIVDDPEKNIRAFMRISATILVAILYALTLILEKLP